MKYPIIIENLFSNQYMDRIEESCTQSPWNYSNNITYTDSNFKHIVNGYSYKFDKKTHQYWLYQYLIYKSFEQINFDIKKIIRIRKRLTLPNNLLYNIPYQPHTDYSFEHLTLLYYVNKSDGDTYVYNEKFDKEDNIPENFSILKKINFKKGKVAIFNGTNYHASSLSSKNNRVVLNINVSGNFKK